MLGAVVVALAAAVAVPPPFVDEEKNGKTLYSSIDTGIGILLAETRGRRRASPPPRQTPRDVGLVVVAVLGGVLVLRVGVVVAVVLVSLFCMIDSGIPRVL